MIYLGPSSIMHQARFGVARSSQPRIEPSGRASLVERALQTIDCPVDPIALRPPPDLETILMETYFEGQNAVLPMLHRPTYDRALEGGRFDNDASFRSLCSPGIRSALQRLLNWISWQILPSARIRLATWPILGSPLWW